MADEPPKPKPREFVPILEQKADALYKQWAGYHTEEKLTTRSQEITGYRRNLDDIVTSTLRNIHGKKDGEAIPTPKIDDDNKARMLVYNIVEKIYTADRGADAWKVISGMMGADEKTPEGANKRNMAFKMIREYLEGELGVNYANLLESLKSAPNVLDLAQNENSLLYKLISEGAVRMHKDYNAISTIEERLQDDENLRQGFVDEHNKLITKHGVKFKPTAASPRYFARAMGDMRNYHATPDADKGSMFTSRYMYQGRGYVEKPAPASK